MADEEPLLAVRNLRTSFATERGAVHAVDGISFEIYPGEVFGVVGESGSGKSVTALSLLQLLDANGTVEADAVRFRGEELLTKSEPEMQEVRGGDISMVFQDPMTSLNPVMSIGEQIAEVYRQHGSDESAGFWAEMGRKYVTGTDKESESWQRAVSLLDTVGIPDPAVRASEYPHQLSGGMRQRVVIAQALAGDPDLIIADEPTTALDVSIEAQILNELLRLRDEFDISVMLITHDLGVVRETCDRVAVMYAGELMERATADDLFEDPKHPYTQGLLGSIPRINDDREWLDAIEGSVPNLIDKPDGCPFAERCDHAFELCDQPLVAYPAGEGTNQNHFSHCHLYNDHVHLDEDGKVVAVDEAAYDYVRAETAGNDAARADGGGRR
ncbi:ABC transporter ATP-binding protein [Halolamina sp.]|jgi:peptide/nickel transport system ATP-binding protein|uniref:ABC transporter ATP-binding protein n=1 Tax=Halolamina sp. TaxID=1940283 RepID=UPI000223BC1B|nr:oligopeptide/dipeptide ABC transporter, ATPase subunit [halophilic archaeon DL31]